YREIPNGSYIESFMKIAFTGATFSCKNCGNLFFTAQFMGKRYTIGYSKLGAKVRDHTYYFKFLGAKMETAVPSFSKTTGLPLPLRKKPVQRDLPGSKYSKVPVHRKYIFIFMQGMRNSY